MVYTGSWESSSYVVVYQKDDDVVGIGPNKTYYFGIQPGSGGNLPGLYK